METIYKIAAVLFALLITFACRAYINKLETTLHSLFAPEEMTKLTDGDKAAKDNFLRTFLRLVLLLCTALIVVAVILGILEWYRLNH